MNRVLKSLITPFLEKGELPDISGQLIKPHSFSDTHLD